MSRHSDPYLADLFDQASDDERIDRARAKRAGFDNVDEWVDSLYDEPIADAALERSLKRAGYLGGEK